MKFKSILLILVFNLSLSSFAKDTYNIRLFGAVGDGIANDTQAIQNAIDRCHNDGGGVVRLEGGKFLSGTLFLKSNVALYIEAGSVLVGSSNSFDYPIIQTNYPAVSGEFLVDKALIYAEEAQNIAVLGTGTIDGSGDDLEHMIRPRPHIIVFRRCHNINVKNVKLYNAAFWVQKYQSCKNILIDGITVESRENKDIELPRFINVPGGRNTDGCNIVDCKDVRISNCFIDSGDDGIVFKSFLRDEGCNNIAVSNCIITTNASGIKIGTESAGNFSDFVINNCVIYNTRGAALGLMTVDGANIERILISNISMRNIKGTAIFIRLGDRGRIYEKDKSKPDIGKINDILFQNIYGYDIERYGCSITGIEGGRPNNITFDNIDLKFIQTESPLLFEGYPERPLTTVNIDSVPELVETYPRGEMFGKLPAYGFYVRHVDNIEFSDINLTPNEFDVRPAIIADDINRINVNNLKTTTSKNTHQVIFKDVKDSDLNKPL